MTEEIVDGLEMGSNTRYFAEEAWIIDYPS